MQDAAGRSSSATMLIRIPTQTVFLSGSATDYTITANPNSQTVTHGNQATSTITFDARCRLQSNGEFNLHGVPEKLDLRNVPNSIT